MPRGGAARTPWCGRDEAAGAGGHERDPPVGEIEQDAAQDVREADRQPDHAGAVAQQLEGGNPLVVISVGDTHQLLNLNSRSSSQAARPRAKFRPSRREASLSGDPGG